MYIHTLILLTCDVHKCVHYANTHKSYSLYCIINMDIYIHIHTYIHTCIHTYINFTNLI